METQKNYPSDIVVDIDFSVLIGKMKVIDRRPWITRLRDWLNFKKYEPQFSLTYKFYVQECPYVRAGWTIETDNGLQWFITVRSTGSLVCEPTEDLTQEQIAAMDKYHGQAKVVYTGFDEEQI